MNFRNWIAATCAAMISVAAAQAAEQYEAETTKAHCTAEWPDDFQMQAYCIEQISDGYDETLRLEAGEPADLDTAALRKCRSDWLPQWNMVAYCQQQQVAGIAGLPDAVEPLPADVAANVLSKCAEDWPADYAMQSYCVGQQVEAWRGLQ